MCSRSPGQGHSYRLAGSLAARGRPEIPARLCTFHTVECAKPVAPATWRGPQPVLRRQAQIARSSSGASWRGERCGRLERSNNACGCRPPSSQRCHQRCAVAGATPKATAARRSEQPSSTARTSATRPASPSLALDVQQHPSPPLSVSPGRPTASKEGRIEPQPFTTSVGRTARTEVLVPSGVPSLGAPHEQRRPELGGSTPLVGRSSLPPASVLRTAHAGGVDRFGR